MSHRGIFNKTHLSLDWHRIRERQRLSTSHWGCRLNLDTWRQHQEQGCGTLNQDIDMHRCTTKGTVRAFEGRTNRFMQGRLSHGCSVSLCNEDLSPSLSYASSADSNDTSHWPRKPGEPWESLEHQTTRMCVKLTPATTCTARLADRSKLRPQCLLALSCLHTAILLLQA